MGKHSKSNRNHQAFSDTAPDNNKSVIRQIEFTELTDGTAVMTISFGEKACLDHEIGLRGLFHDSHCKPDYVIGEIAHGNPLHDELHKIVPVFIDGEPSSHYHFHLKSLEYQDQALGTLYHFVDSGAAKIARNNVHNWGTINPFIAHSLWTQPTECSHPLLGQESLARIAPYSANVTADLASCIAPSFYWQLPMGIIMLLHLLNKLINWLLPEVPEQQHRAAPRR